MKRRKRTKATQHHTRQGDGDSNYARKAAYCARHSVWGWEVPEPKPWKRK